MIDCCIQRLKRATELIEKDDAARDALGLEKPSYEEMEGNPNLKQPLSCKCDEILSNLGLACNPPGGTKKDGKDGNR